MNLVKNGYITEYLQRNAEEAPSKDAIIFEGKTVTWQELWISVQSLAPLIHEKLGAKEQAVVAILLPNSIEFIVTYLAILHAGHIAMPLDPAFKKLELDAILSQINPAFLATDKESAGQISSYKEVLFVDEVDFSHRQQPDYRRLPADKLIASLTFTSGTTGRPKAAPNTHYNHIWNIKACSEAWKWTSSDTLLVSVPLSHMLGIVMGLSGSIYHGNTMYLQRWFDEVETLEALSSGKVSFFSHASSAYVKLTQFNSGKYDLSAVRLCVSGAAPLSPATWHDFKKRYGVKIVETYGTTETGRIAANRLDRQVLGSPGQILPGVKYKLSKEGEILVKSPGVFPGYYHNETATKEGFTSDGYWRTGDLVELKKGNVVLKGRSQERIRRYGYTISPRDVEWAMHQNPKVSDIYVMGKEESGRADDELIYFIVTTMNDEEIMSYARENLLFAWRPDKIIHLDDLPRTRSGKSDIANLQKLAARKT